jgi:hypothetical protein
LNYTKDIGSLADADVRVYMITHSGSERVYIGITRKPLSLRLSVHKTRAKYLKKNNLTMSFKDRWIVNAIDAGHEIKIDELDVVKFPEFSFWEKYYISLFKMFGFKLTNGTEGGDGAWPRRVSEEEKEALRKLKCKPVLEYDRFGNVINRYESLKQTSEITGLDYSRLSHSVRGTKRLCDNRMFRYEDISVTKDYIDWCFEKRNLKKCKPVLQFDLSGNFVAEYESAASTPFGSAVSAVCLGKRNQTGGYVWKYKNE